MAREIEAQAEVSPQARLLMSVPGIGHYSALFILAEVGETERFRSPKNLVSCAGFPPSVYASESVLRYGRITKQGSAWLRWTLMQAAQQARGRSPRLQRFYNRVAERKGKATAKVALARELLVIIWHMLVKNQPDEEPRCGLGQPQYLLARTRLLT